MPVGQIVYLWGDTMARSPQQPQQVANYDQPGFGMNVIGAEAIGSSTEAFRLVWTANSGNDTQFAQGPMWNLERYTGPEPFETTGPWETVALNLVATPDLSSGVAGGDDWMVFNQQSGPPWGTHYIFDINRSFPETATNAFYSGYSENVPGHLTFAEANNAFDDSTPPCFTLGTLIDTTRGPRPVEELAAGDLVLTRDHGPQPIRWIGGRRLGARTLMANERFRPIRIRTGALGQGLPATDLVVSPQHRILVRSSLAERMFGAPEVLVAAKQLLQVEGIDIATDMAEVRYFHILFDRHEVVVANGAETESLYTGPEALKAVGRQALEEIFDLFPELRSRDYAPSAARVLVSGRQARKLAIRHLQQKKPLVA